MPGAEFGPIFSPAVLLSTYAAGVPSVAVLLTLAYVYVTERRGELDGESLGLTAYAVVLIAASAVVAATGAARVFAALSGSLFAESWTYVDDPFSGSTRIDGAIGGGLLLAGWAGAGIHVRLRGRFLASGMWDDAYERAAGIFVTGAAGLATVWLAGRAVAEFAHRAWVADSGATPLGALSAALAAACLWAIYLRRTLDRRDTG